jgi:hypothetical protein
MKKHITATTPEGNSLLVTLSTERDRFSVTGQLSREGDMIYGGAMHEEILQILPELKPVIDLHLSELDGTPMLAFENGFYWLSKVIGILTTYSPEQDAETCFCFFLQHMRISEPEAYEIFGQVTNAYLEGRAQVALSKDVSVTCQTERTAQGIAWARACFSSIVERQRPRWKNEAERILAVFFS